ncbi:MAG: hypothetical protein LBT26_03865 [Clostridiales Family XIII bacterium]|jgi:hypothetical protein|nr:hypothetical protein [Clostridiales Family XIII bacterium]
MTRETFLVQVLNWQNATWQGTINWIERQETQPFRSLLEMIKLMDSALEDEGERREWPGERAEKGEYGRRAKTGSKREREKKARRTKLSDEGGN